jgi:hypothetical protein
LWYIDGKSGAEGMQNREKRTRVRLVALLITTVLVNTLYTGILFTFNLNSDIGRYEEFIAGVKRGVMEIDKKHCIDLLSAWREYITASDELLIILQKSVALLAIINIAIVALTILSILRKRYSGLE